MNFLFFKKKPKRKTTYYENGRIKNVSYFKDGTLTHRSTDFWPNGNVKAIWLYEAGMLTGDIVQFDENGFLQRRSVQVNNTMQEVTDYNPNGTISTITTYVNGKRETIRCMSENGSFEEAIIPYKDDLREGVAVKYDKFGRPLAKTTYQKDIKNGTETLYFYNPDNTYGYMEIPYINNVRHGLQKIYNHKNQLIEEAVYENDKLINKISHKVEPAEPAEDGYAETKYYNETKNVSEECWYDANRRCRHKYKYFPDGKLHSAEHYDENGQRDGLEVVSREDGHVACIYMYKNGKQHGTFCNFRKSGKLDGFARFENGQQNGVTVSYNESGRELERWQLSSNRRHGISEAISEDGTYVQVRSPYVNGNLNGTEYFYDENLNVIKKVAYKDGQKV